MYGRNPTKKDIIKGCISFLKDMIAGLISFDMNRVMFDWIMVKETAKGNFEVVDEEGE